jgi:hypothetical protein
MFEVVGCPSLVATLAKSSESEQSAIAATAGRPQ